jgi:putative two-component system response regulator
MNVATILVVDDAPENLAVLSELLMPHYRVLAASSGEAALRIVGKGAAPDLILLDVMMPGMDGYAVLAELQKNPDTANIPVLFLTALARPEDEKLGLQLGAADYISKPMQPVVVLARIRTQLQAKQARDWLQNKNESLEAEVNRRMRENDLTQLAGIRALAHLAEMRDPETGAHILRTQSYVQHLATLLHTHLRFSTVLTGHYIDLLTRSAPLHDIGKVGIPDHILLKPGSLDANEAAIMQTHARLGSEAIEAAERDIREPLPFLLLAKEIALAHHEKWDGSGYPQGLAGEAIPLSARIMAVADVFDALISSRVYKTPLSYQHAREVIAQGRGKHFDPDIVDVFLAHFQDFVAIAERYSAVVGVTI